MILVDTSIWSVAFRRRKAGEEFSKEVESLKSLLKSNHNIGVPGAVLQELLSGLREESQFERLSRLMDGFPLILATEEDHIRAAKISNICRKNGVAAKTVDCLLAAMAIERNAQLFTSDKDFGYIAEHTSLELFSID